MIGSTQATVENPSDSAADADRILSVQIGGKTIGDRLAAAVAAGHVIVRPDGKLELVKQERQDYIFKPGEFGRPCGFLNGFMFTHVYGKTAVPFGCRNCYKVKVTSSTLRQLMAVKEVSEAFSCLAKSGVEVDNHENQSLYGTYFYLLGLEKARAVYKKVRRLIDAHPKLGPAVKAVIKRGCTNYERSCGPSDRYTFDPRLSDIEDYFFARYAEKKPDRKIRKQLDDAKKLLKMARTAYSIGDDTYKDFTGGKDLLPPTVTYDPDDTANAADAG